MSEDLVNIEVDGVPVKARKGAMLIQATDAQGIYVPRFYDVDYLEDGRIQRVERCTQNVSVGFNHRLCE